MYARIYVCVFSCKVSVILAELASRIRTFCPDPARKLSANLYDIYHCCVYSEKLLMMVGNCPKHVEFYSKNKFEKLVHLIGFIIRTGTYLRIPPPPIVQQIPVSQGLLIIEASRSHSDTPHSVELLWTSDQPVAETSTRKHTTLRTDVHGHGGIQTPQSQQASGLRPHGHWDRHLLIYMHIQVYR